MKPVDVKPSIFIDSFKIGDINRISKYKNIFQKAIFKIGLKTFLWFKTLKTPFHGRMLLLILKAKKLLEHFTKNNCKNKSKRV